CASRGACCANPPEPGCRPRGFTQHAPRNTGPPVATRGPPRRGSPHRARARSRVT
ncbi:MAG: hypothetical protein AVDCRST_MAG11-235, partial [uncultured Gemmatimonadaceae bacterium]